MKPFSASCNLTLSPVSLSKDFLAKVQKAGEKLLVTANSIKK